MRDAMGMNKEVNHGNERRYKNAKIIIIFSQGVGHENYFRLLCVDQSNDERCEYLTNRYPAC